jgi:hypothetical protein
MLRPEAFVAVVDACKLDGAPYYTLLAALTYANPESREVFPRLELWARRARLHPSTVSEARRQLVRAGVLHQVGRAAPGRAPRYVVLEPPVALSPEDAILPGQLRFPDARLGTREAVNASSTLRPGDTNGHPQGATEVKGKVGSTSPDLQEQALEDVPPAGGQSPDPVWERVRERLRQSVPGPVFEIWIGPASGWVTSSGHLAVAAGAASHEAWLADRFGLPIRRAARAEGFDVVFPNARPARRPRRQRGRRAA